REDRHGERRHGDQRRVRGVAAVSAGPGRLVNATVEQPSSPSVRRRVVQLMGMPISLALRGRHADTAAAERAWDDVVAELRTVDRVFSTYRTDSVIYRLNRGELDLEDCPPEVHEVLSLGRDAEQQSGG